MSNHIEIYKGQVFITEQTLRELLHVVDEAKKRTLVPTNIDVLSEYSGVQFNIDLEVVPHTQESLGYKLFPCFDSVKRGLEQAKNRQFVKNPPNIDEEING